MGLWSKLEPRQPAVGTPINPSTALPYSDAEAALLALKALIPAAGAAPADAQYLVASANATLTGERVTTDTPTVAWDHTTPAQAKANVVTSALDAAALLALLKTVDGAASGLDADLLDGQSSAAFALLVDLASTANAKGASLVGIEDAGSYYAGTTVEAALAAVGARVASLDAAVVLRGSWAANAGTFPGGGTAQAGDSYVVSASGTVDGVAFTTGDRIIALADNASTTTYAANWLKADYSDLVSSVAGKTGVVTLQVADITDMNTAVTPGSYTNMNATVDQQGRVTAAANGSAGVGKNALINGSMRVAQRGTSFTSTGGANNDDVYVLDRWNLLSDGNDIVDVTQAQDVPAGALFSMGLDVETANKKFGILQVIEQKNCADLIGQTVTLSAYLKVTNTTRLDKIKMAIIAWDGTADTVTSDIVSAWGADGTNPTLVANWTYENTPADLGVTTGWARYSVSAAVDTASAKNIGLFIWSDNVTDTDLGDFLYIANVKLELGAAPTAFETPSFADELAQCQRYFVKLIPDTAPSRGPVGFWGTGGAGGNVQFGFALPATMRVLPSIAFNDMTTSDASGNHATTSALMQYAAGPMIGFSLTSSASGGTVNTASQMRFASTASYVQFSAEL